MYEPPVRGSAHRTRAIAVVYLNMYTAQVEGKTEPQSHQIDEFDEFGGVR